jgi:serine/threonine protein kinase
MADRLGQQLGNYRLVSLLGQGGYAEVYLGQHVRFNQQAAIKVLHAHLSGVEAEHFQQEAETIATLAHPSIIRVLDFDVQEGVPFLVIDYAPNGSLRQRYPKGSLVPLPVIVSSVKQVADALQYAHEQKFIHRDVKPENMLVGRRQEVLLSDFGIATIAHSTSSLSTSAEGTSGTLAYMAPEQIEGHPRAASDQYALGVVVYEWLCGERPFEGSVSELIAQQLSVPPLPLRERIPTILSEVEQVVLRALAKDSKARFATVADFAKALEQASQHALAPTGQLASEQPAPSSDAATSYETLAVAPSQPLLATESTPSADLSVGELEPTVYTGVSAQNGLNTPQNSQSFAPRLLLYHLPWSQRNRYNGSLDEFLEPWQGSSLDWRC